VSSDHRSVLIHQAYSQESGQFDRFVLGATLAGCAYLGQTIPYGQLGYNIETMYLYSLLVLSISAAMGFKRIEYTLNTAKGNSKYLHALETRDLKGAAAYHGLMLMWADSTGFYYRIRNITLILGFACYVATKVFAAYIK